MPVAPITVDAHHHVWDLAVRPQDWLAGPEMAPINRTYLEPELAQHAEDHGIDASVLVQTVTLPDETPEFLDVAAASSVIAAVTGWVDLTGEDVADELATLLAHPHGGYLRAIRAQVQGEADPRWLCRPDVRRGFVAVGAAGLLGELVILPAQLPAVVETVRDVPEVTWVLDHAGKPDLRSGDLAAWSTAMRELGRSPNVVCKLSGLVTEADWDAWDLATLRPVAEVVLEAFGPDRVMIGSDWPVCELAGDYGRVIEAYRALLDGLSADERAAVEGVTAARVYGIG